MKKYQSTQNSFPKSYEFYGYRIYDDGYGVVVYDSKGVPVSDELMTTREAEDFVKSILSNDESYDVSYADYIDELMRTRQGKRIFGKFMNKQPAYAEAWLQGVVETLDILDKNIPGVAAFWEDVLSDGVEAVRRKLM